MATTVWVGFVVGDIEIAWSKEFDLNGWQKDYAGFLAT